MNKSMQSTDSWSTPKDLFESLDREFHFNDDPYPLNDNPIFNGLTREWGTSTFLNPPYSNPEPWVRKAYEESQRGKTVVALLRGDTSTAWFHNFILNKAEIRFIRGRLRFGGNKLAGGPCPFASIIAIWRVT